MLLEQINFFYWQGGGMASHWRTTASHFPPRFLRFTCCQTVTIKKEAQNLKSILKQTHVHGPTQMVGPICQASLARRGGHPAEGRFGQPC